jgi:hypothetical protein
MKSVPLAAVLAVLAGSASAQPVDPLAISSVQIPPGTRVADIWTPEAMVQAEPVALPSVDPTLVRAAIARARLSESGFSGETPSAETSR